MANVNFYRGTKANIDNVAYTDGQIYFPTDENKILLDTGNARKQYGGDTEIDSALSTTSTNPVQNKVVTTTLNQKLAKTDIVNDLASAVAVTSTATPVGCGAIKELNSNLDDHTTFPSSQGGFYPDYQGGEMGYNTLESRGADTFHPFKGWKCLTDTAVSGSQTFDLTTLFPSNYQNLTVDNFIIKIDSIRATGSTNMRVEASNAGNVNFTTLMTIYTIPNKSISNNILTTSASTNGTLSASHPGDNTNTSFSSILNYKVYYLN